MMKDIIGKQIHDELCKEFKDITERHVNKRIIEQKKMFHTYLTSILVVKKNDLQC